MRFALNDNLPCPDRQDPVTAQYCRWRVETGFYPRYERRYRCQRETIKQTRDVGIVVTGDFTGLNRKDTTQISIALCRALTACLPPAVSSLEACQTPAR